MFNLEIVNFVINLSQVMVTIDKFTTQQLSSFHSVPDGATLCSVNMIGIVRQPCRSTMITICGRHFCFALVS